MTTIARRSGTLLIAGLCLADLLTFLWLGQRNGQELNGPLMLLYARTGIVGLVAAKLAQASLIVALAEWARRSKVAGLPEMVVGIAAVILLLGVAGNVAGLVGFSITV